MNKVRDGIAFLKACAFFIYAFKKDSKKTNFDVYNNYLWVEALKTG